LGFCFSKGLYYSSKDNYNLSYVNRSGRIFSFIKTDSLGGREFKKVGQYLNAFRGGWRTDPVRSKGREPSFGQGGIPEQGGNRDTWF